ncbi:MAG: hypothetical protein R3C11_04560 [Planctomycetaceae bacterium]
MRSNFFTIGIILVVGLNMSSRSEAQTSYPMLMSLDATAIQVGQTSELTVHSRYSMFGATQVIVSGEGVTCEIATEMKLDKDGKEPSLTELIVRFTAAADALTGVRDFRINTPNGVSTLGQLVVTSLPVQSEDPKQDNNSPEKAHEVTLPATICGTIEKNEDVDCFKFHIEEPGDWTFHMQAMRLEDRIHDLQSHVDPIITLRSSTGATLAVCDNHFYADPFLSYHFDQPGDYQIEIRDVRYQGNKFWSYALEVDRNPFVSVAYPLAVVRGRENEIQLLGESVPENTISRLTVSPESPLGEANQPFPINGKQSNPVKVLVTDTEPALESTESHSDLETAQQVTFPGLVAGRILQEGELDLYRFEAKKDSAYRFEILSRRLQSSLDSNLRILDSTGKALLETDDMTVFRMSYSDSLVDKWVAPTDGVFYLEVRDLHLREETYSYLIKATEAKPHFELYVDTDKTLVSPSSPGVLLCTSRQKKRI